MKTYRSPLSGSARKPCLVSAYKPVNDLRECAAAHSRKSFDGLQALVRHGLGEDPLSGGLYVFINRRATQMRVLYFDRSGFCIWAKRLEAGRFVSDWAQVRTREMDWTGQDLS
jgi:transposase